MRLGGGALCGRRGHLGAQRGWDWDWRKGKNTLLAAAAAREAALLRFGWSVVLYTKDFA